MIPFRELMPWVEDGACRNTEGDWLEIPTVAYTTQRQVKRAEIAVCMDCPVLAECREHAITFPEPLGVWGGLVPRERGKIRAQRRKRAQARRRP